MAQVRSRPIGPAPAGARQVLDRLWTQPGASYAAFAGKHLLQRAAAEDTTAKEAQLNENDVDQYLTQEPAYTRHAPSREKFARPFYNLTELWHLVETDLLDVSRLANFNQGVRYLLLAIECTSRKLFVKPLKNKEGQTCAEAFEQLIEHEFDQLPHLIRSDRGSEYKDHHFQGLLRKHKIRHVFASNTQKCAMVERAGRTLMTRLHRMMTYTNSYQFLTTLPDIVKSINDTPHASTGIAPNHFTPSDVYRSWERYYIKHLPLPKHRPFRFRIGDRVRVSLLRTSFSKAYRGSYSPSLFTVSGYRLTRPHSYELSNNEGKRVAGLFFEPELVRAEDRSDQEYMIEKVHDTRVNPKTREKEQLVSWVGWPSSVRSWVPEVSQVTTAVADYVENSSESSADEEGDEDDPGPVVPARQSTPKTRGKAKAPEPPRRKPVGRKPARRKPVGPRRPASKQPAIPTVKPAAVAVAPRKRPSRAKPTPPQASEAQDGRRRSQRLAALT